MISQKNMMEVEQALADVVLKSGDRSIKLKALVDTGASRSLISRSLADELGAFIPLDEPYELRTADKGGEAEDRWTSPC